MTTTREPRGKSDATATAVVNGPEDDALDWQSVDWRRVEDEVARLRQRIFTASQARDCKQVGDCKKVRNLQKLLLRPRSNALVSVQRVTERNAGRLTAGIDGVTAARRRRDHRRGSEVEVYVDVHGVDWNDLPTVARAPTRPLHL